MGGVLTQDSDHIPTPAAQGLALVWSNSWKAFLNSEGLVVSKVTHLDRLVLPKLPVVMTPIGFMKSQSCEQRL